MVAHVDSYLAQIELNNLVIDLNNYATTSTLDAKYEKVDIVEVIEEKCSNLNAKQKRN